MDITKNSGSLLIKGGVVVTFGENSRVLTGHGVLVENGRIAKVAPMTEFNTHSSVREIDAQGKVVMPGLINTHMHFYSSFARGLGKAKPSANFNEVLNNLWWRLDRKLTHEDVYCSALVALIDCVRHGTTTIIDHHSSPGTVSGSLNEIARAVTETGLRACLCYEVSDRDGPETAQAGLAENAEFARQCRNEGGDQLRALFGLHASFTLSEDTLERAVDEARKFGGGFHVHVAEAASDEEHCLKHFGMRVIERFAKSGVLGPKTICAHCVHVNEQEIELLSQTKTRVVHNPQSNMNNAVGTADVLKLRRARVLTGLGTDAMTNNMFEELRSALWAQRILHKNPSVGFGEMLDALFLGNAHIADTYWNLGLGTIIEGAAADIVLVDYDPPTPLTTDTLGGHLYFGISQASVDTTIASGKVLMQNKKLLLDFDEERVCARSRELAIELWKRF